MQILNQPLDLSVDEGETAVFSVIAQGSNLSYQWQFNNQDIPGAVTDTYTIDNVQAGDAGVYKVIVTGDCRQVVSDEANLNVVLGWREREGKDVKIYPNPVTAILYIESENITGAYVKIYDVTGKIILQKKLNQTITNLDIRKIKKGIYLMEIQ